MNKRIEVRRGDEYCTKISNIYAEEDFFHEAYSKAAQGVRDVVQATKEFYQNRDQSQNVTEYMRLARFPNNFIAFCAGRGQGKTSAMVSFSSALRKLGQKTDKTELEQNFWGGTVADCSFYVLDPIDPTMMDQKDSILRIVISRMFECYAQEEQQRRSWRNIYAEREPELLNLFRKCYRSLDVLQKGRDLQDCYDDLEYLADLGDSSHMKRTFQELVFLFLELIFQVKPGDGQKFLVLQIDDADLSASNSYRIVEELRKYCTVPNVIILMATDLKQMELTVEQHFIEELQTLCKYKKNDVAVPGHCHKMMERYLDKLIPGARQVHLPMIDNYIKDHGDELELVYLDQEQPVHSGAYQAALLQMIYKKTGLILISPKGYPHNLLPKSMRELTHLLAFLDRLKPIDVKNGALSNLIKAWQATSPKEGSSFNGDNLMALELRLKNADAFMLYLRHCWAKAALTEKQQAVVFPAMEATMDMKIRQLLTGLWAYGVARPPEDEISYQYVDVIKAIDELKSKPNCSEEFGLIYISATILTLYMNLLAMQDLKEGLEFNRLKKFMGDGVFRPGTGAYTQGGLQYDQWEIDHDLTLKMAAGSNTLDTAETEVRTAIRLLVTKRGDQEGAISRAGILDMFKNCLEQTAQNGNPELTAELLDIILSWDIQYHIRKALIKKNEETGSQGYESWLLKQFGTIDDVYRNALEELKITTVSPMLQEVFENQKILLVALAMGNEAYAKQWWFDVKGELEKKLESAKNILDGANEVSGLDAEERTQAIINNLVQCGEKLKSLNMGISRLVVTNEVLYHTALYNGDIKPQRVIDEAQNILQLPEDSQDLLEDQDSQGAKTMEFLKQKAGNVLQVQREITECIKKLESVQLYFQEVKVTKKRQRQGKMNTPKKTTKTQKPTKKK